jgi:hypothetical protein
MLEMTREGKHSMHSIQEPLKLTSEATTLSMPNKVCSGLKRKKCSVCGFVW